MKHTVNHLVSSNWIPIHLQLDETLPPVDLQLDRQSEVLTAAQAKAEYYKSVGLSDNIFVTLTQSLERGLDLGVDITPCLRPSHRIYSLRMRRWLTPKEAMSLQGVWADDMDALQKEAFKELLQEDALAYSMAGNAFTSTVFKA